MNERKYEDLYNELQEIVLKLQNEEVEIDEAIELFKKAIILKKACSNILDKAQDEVAKILTENGELDDFNS